MGREEGLSVLQVQDIVAHQIWFSSLKKMKPRRERRRLMKTWSESEDDSSKEENEKEVANMCFMAIDELDKVNSNISYDDLHDAFEDLDEDLQKLGLKNVSLKKKIQQLEKELGEVKEKFSNVEVSKTFLEKRNEILIKKNEWLTSSRSIFSCGQKSFEIILASQKCTFDKQGLIFKSS